MPTTVRDAPADTQVALAAEAPPIGAVMPYAGQGDPPGGVWVLADGRLIDKTAYAGFFAATGHAYNGGVDPGSNKVRIPDKRGRVPVGADNMGTALGAAGRLPSSNRGRGQSGGAEVHGHTVNSHSHGGNVGGVGTHRHNFLGSTSGFAITGEAVADSPSMMKIPSDQLRHAHNVSGQTDDQGAHGHTISPEQPGTTSSPTLQPYEVDNVIVRIA